ncbi:MAG: methylenetetrahydrofolate reductase, partial [Pseudomonadota bacterium]|nr:methylenetetrahydrofolate reductase [Pseudomonadota bacterium]
MLRIVDAYGPDRFGLSFELFPPKTEKGERALFRHVEELAKFNPSFITCTYGAGGSTRDKTLDVVQ